MALIKGKGRAKLGIARDGASANMGYGYAGETGMLAGFSWAALCNWQQGMAWFRRPWYHAGGMAAGYCAFKLAAAYEDAQLKGLIASYERKGYVIPEDRKLLFEPSQYK